jgi:2-keto-4-pentenoate hydratase
MNSEPESQYDLSAGARRLLADFDARQPWRSFVMPKDLTAKQAYALQGEVSRLREGRGERVIGYKVGCTSRVIQEQLGTDEPIFGRVFDSGCFPPGSRLSHARFAGLAVEGEIAIRLSRDIPCHPLPDEGYTEAIGSVFPVIELHHLVLPAGGRPLAALIASGGIHAGLVPADRETPSPGRVPALEVLEVLIDGRLAGTSTEPWTMGDPAGTLRWLTGQLAEWGEELRAGQVILTGSALPLFPVGPGSRVEVEARPLGRAFAEFDP